MEELIGILFLVVALIFKIIDKKFSNASAKSAPSADQKEAFPMVEETPMVYEMPVFKYEYKPTDAPEPKPVSKPEQKPSPKPVVRPSVKAKPILKEEVKKPREKIDPKKLIVYSEIMNRKY